MARSRFLPNLLYGSLGLAVTGVAAFYAFRTLRRRRAERGDEDAMLSIRRASRKTGRAAKEAGKKVGRGIEDAGERVGDTITDVGNEFQSTSGYESPLNRV
jgi:hypothetical protein